MSAEKQHDPNDFEIIEPPLREAIIKGEAHFITPMKVGQLPAFAAAASSIISDLNIEELEDGKADMVLNPETIGKHGETIIKAVAIAVREKESEIADMDLDEFIRLARVVFEVNRDFFKERVVPAFRKATEGIAGAGQTPSPS